MQLQLDALHNHRRELERELLKAEAAERQRQKEISPVSSQTESAGQNLISRDVEIRGSIKFTNELVIDGKIEGEISGDETLTLGKNAGIRGEIRAKSITVLGKVSGNITVAGRCELKGDAHLLGDLRASRLIIEEGATFIGRSYVPMNSGLVAIKQSTEKPTAKVEVKHAELLRTGA